MTEVSHESQRRPQSGPMTTSQSLGREVGDESPGSGAFTIAGVYDDYRYVVTSWEAKPPRRKHRQVVRSITITVLLIAISSAILFFSLASNLP